MECPRWRLTAPHHLKVPVLPDGTPVEWEHKETNRDSGRQVRKLYPVPLLLDPRDAADHNHPGEIVVAREVEGSHMIRGDIVFLGDPTPDMEPLNDAAQAITDSLRPRWEHPIDTLPVNGGMSSAEKTFMEAMMKSFAQSQPAAAPTTSVSIEQYDALKAELESLKAMLTGAKPEAPARRV